MAGLPLSAARENRAHRHHSIRCFVVARFVPNAPADQEESDREECSDSNGTDGNASYSTWREGAGTNECC
jgi:hypothetical protein